MAVTTHVESWAGFRLWRSLAGRTRPDGKLFRKEPVELAGVKLWLAPGFTILMLLLVTAVGAFRLG